MSFSSSIARVALLASFAFAVGCQPEIGDDCSNSLDCSANRTRICDLASKGGYCTVKNCDPDACPSGALCVEWRADEPRSAETYCMARCSKHSDCRSGYACLREGDPEITEGDVVARVTDQGSRRNKGFCAYLGD